MNRYHFENGDGQHLHTLDGKPLQGTSTVLNVLAKPLTWWASGLAVSELGWSNPKLHSTDARLANVRTYLERIKAMDAPEFLKLLDKAYRAHSAKLDKSAKQGTDMHAELERFVQQVMEENDGVPPKSSTSSHRAVQIFAEWAAENVARFIASEAHCYSEELHTGGIVDLVYEDKQGRIVILDFKSSKDAYLSQFFQDAGYDIAITENGMFDAAGNLICKLDKEVSYYGVFPFGMAEPAPQFHFDVAGGKTGFRSCVTLHKLINSNN